MVASVHLNQGSVISLWVADLAKKLQTSDCFSFFSAFCSTNYNADKVADGSDV